MAQARQRKNSDHVFFREPENHLTAIVAPSKEGEQETYFQDDFAKETEKFNPIVSLVILFVVGFLTLEALRFIVPSDVYHKFIGHDSDLLLLVIAALVAVFFVTVVGFFRLLVVRRKNERERALMSSVLEGSKGARFVCRSDGKAIYTNKKFERIVDEVEDEEDELTSLLKFFKLEDTQPNFFKDLIKTVKTNQTQVDAELPIYDDAGKVSRWYEITVTRMQGWRDFIHIRLDDITQRRAFEKNIDSERQRLLDFMDNALVGFFSVDKKGRFVFANATLARWLGLADDVDFMNHHLHDFIAEPLENAELYDVISGGGAHQNKEIYLKDIEGNTFPVAISHTIVYEDDDTIYSQSIVRNLSHEKEITDALRASEDRFHRFFEDAPTGILLLSEDGRIEEANKSFQDMIGRKPAHILGKHLKEQIKLEFHEALDNFISQANEMSSSFDRKGELILEAELQAPANLPVQLSVSRLRGAQSFILHVADLTKLKQLETQFTQSQKMQAVGQLAGGVAHDFNNLLTAMIGFCDLLLERHRPGDPSFQDLMQIKQNANRAANLVRQLLAFSRQQTLRPAILDVSDVIADLSNLLRRLIGVNIKLKMNHGRDLWQIKADHGQMEQVFINLVVNARDAMKEGIEEGQKDATIEIITSNFDNSEEIELISDVMPAGEWLRIEVKDQGHGIDPENLSRIFDPFFTTKKMGEGTGLGLSTVYGIIRQTGGFIDVISAVGQGTSFVIFLPRVSQEEIEKLKKEKAEEAKTAKDLTGSEIVLLIEDEEAVRKFGARALSNKGYEVFEAENGVEGLELYKKMETKPGLVITDVMMPEMDGPTVAKELQAINPDTKIMFVSGFSEDRISDYQGDNIYFLAKPYSLKDLAAKVKEILDGE